MGLSTKQVSGDQGIDGSQTLQQFDAAELSKPPVRRQQQQQQQSDVSQCPRCESSNTKFCYYNNYNKSQPRHFCKSCKRHWTKGGTLRNVPLGGARKNKRPKISNATNTAATSTIDDQKPTSSSGFYQADLIGHDQPFLGSDKGVINNNNTTTTSATTTTCLNESAQPQNSIAEFQYFSSVSTNIDTNGSLYPVSYQSLNVYDQYSCNLDSMEESTITTVNIPTTSNVPWTGKDNSTMDLSNYWDWNEIDVITSSDHFNLSWDDEEIDGGAKIKP